jgi:hypothetical protein
MATYLPGECAKDWPCAGERIYARPRASELARLPNQPTASMHACARPLAAAAAVLHLHVT